jgi:hypothetical protein
MYRAIKVIPENAQVIREQLDLIVLDMDTETTPRYIVDGFVVDPVGWKMLDEKDFVKQWRFIAGGSITGRFTTVVPLDYCKCGHGFTIHYYGGYGVTENCLVPNCPCYKYDKETDDERRS